jgi:hypothetical protein
LLHEWQTGSLAPHTLHPPHLLPWPRLLAGLELSQQRHRLQNLRERLLAAVATGQDVDDIERLQDDLEQEAGSSRAGDARDCYQRTLLHLAVTPIRCWWVPGCGRLLG